MSKSHHVRISANKPSNKLVFKPALLALSGTALAAILAACGGGGSDNATAVNYDSSKPYVVGTTSFDADLPAEPTLPTDAQVCATLEAGDNVSPYAKLLVKRSDGALAFEADPSTAGISLTADPASVNPDQARIQAALNACGAQVDAEVGAKIYAKDADESAKQIAAAVANKNTTGATGEELAKSTYRATKFAVRLVVSKSSAADSFISGPLTLPSGVTLWIDKGVTLFGTRDATAYNMSTTKSASGKYCANTNLWGKAGSSGNCKALINGDNLVNSAVMGEGAIDSRAYSEIVTTDPKYPLMKVDLSCSNTYDAWVKGTVAADNTPCDNGGTFVDSKSKVRNMTWWDLAYLGNMVENGITGVGSQSNFRMMVFNFAKNLTLYKITMNNSANFHMVPSGVDGLTVWGVKVQTPSAAAYANPAGNQNPLYTGIVFYEDNVKNTDAFDPGSASSKTSIALTTGYDLSKQAALTSSAGKISFDGYMKNTVFAYNYISTGDDDIAIKGSNNPSPAGSGLIGVDGDRDARSDRKYGLMIAHNHIYWGHGISIGSETNSGVANMHVYDNSFNGAEEALRIKSDYARGGEVKNIYYDNICARDTQNALLFTTYYSTKAVSGTAKIPNFHDIFLSNMLIEDSSALKFVGYAKDSNGITGPANPLVMTLKNVVAASPEAMSVTSSDANLTISGVNLPLVSDADRRVVVNGTATKAVDASKFIDCSKAYVDFPTLTSKTGW